LWVEGITDRLYLRRYFELYQDHRSKNEDDFIFWREDTHYSFVEYSGSNLTHWSAGSDGDEAIKMKFLCGDALVICDQDGSQAKNESHQALKDRIGDHAYVLDVREIENLISADVLSRVVCEYENDQSLELKYFTQSAYKTKPIGKFIQEKILPDDYTSARPVKTEQPYAAKSGTIKDKLGFCRKALDHTTSYDHVSQYARVVCERMYDFIKSHQPK
ncbi:MAG: ATP/GTP-binding protein, partial [Phycisphaerales bacterium JB063]